MTCNGRHKLAAQNGACGFYAEVSVEVEPGDVPNDPPVRVLHVEQNRPCSGVDWRIATTFGVHFAVSKLPKDLIGKGLVIKVIEVRGHEVDTGYVELAFAAAWAVWDALRFTPMRPVILP